MSVPNFKSPCANIHIKAIDFQPPMAGVEVCEVRYVDTNRVFQRQQISRGYGPNTFEAILDALANLETENKLPYTERIDLFEPADTTYDLPRDDGFIIPPHDQAPADTGA